VDPPVPFPNTVVKRGSTYNTAPSTGVGRSAAASAVSLFCRYLRGDRAPRYEQKSVWDDRPLPVRFLFFVAISAATERRATSRSRCGTIGRCQCGFSFLSLSPRRRSAALRTEVGVGRSAAASAVSLFRMPPCLCHPGAARLGRGVLRIRADDLPSRPPAARVSRPSPCAASIS
jgi:hypothetical protein